LIVGFVGLGAMGRHMAGNLIQAGHRLRVWNRSPGAAEELAGKGAEVVAEPREAFGEILISMLADDTALREIVLDSGMLDGAARDGIHVNMATISVALTEELTEEHHRRGLHYIAAPVFGRPEAAAARQLNIVAAGDGPALDRVQPLLDAMGQRTWRLGGEPKEAAAAKLAGNFLIAAAIECMGEAVVMAERYGVRPAAFLEILGNTLFASPVYRNYGALIADRRYEPAGFRLELGLKDVRLALAAGEWARTPMPVASLLRDHLLEAIAHGDGQRDWSALAEVARRHAGQVEPGGTERRRAQG
jgi:3-hydroxyisobutyrate dehydrogenase-like beta-hydroxyacid dehydrogenase